MKKNNIKKLITKFVFILFFVFIQTNFTLAANSFLNIFGWGITAVGTFLSGSISFIVFIIGYIFSVIAGLFIAFIAFLIEIVLQLNSQLIQTTFVQTGFLISLSITNLIFVAGIIVIAIATILRLENYGMKNTLWKLIVMAILVNFSLSISGALIKISDNLSNYFLDAINPEVGSGGNSESSKYGAFATAIAGSFTPQRFFTNIMTSTSPNVGTINLINKSYEDVSNMIGSSLADLIKPIIALFFIILFLINTIVVLGSLFILFLNRAISLSFLLIIAPLAWAMWVFPNYKKYWDDWWGKFNKWLIFGPISLFFLYLCILTLRATPGGSNNKIWGLEFTFNPQRKDALGVLESFMGSFLGNIGITIIQMIIMIGCVTGSLIAAEKIGVEGARSLSSTAKNMNNNFKNRFKDWTKNRVQGYAASTMIAQQPPTYTGWRRIFNPINKINYKIGGTAGKVAERFGYAPKLEKISVKYGPEAREAKRKKIQELKAEIEQINQKIKNPEIINEQRKLLEQNIIEIENKLREEKEKIAQNYKNNINELEKELKEKINGMNQELEPLKALLEKELDLNKRQEIQKQIRDKEENYKKSMSGINKRLEEAKQRLNNIDKDAALSKINQELENAKNELNRFYEENTIEYLISQRRKKYEDISEAKPVGLFKALITKEEKKAEKIKKQVKELASLIEDNSDSNKESPSKTSSGPNKSS